MREPTFETMKPLELYKDMGEWCMDFKKENKRKATFNDFFAFKNQCHFKWVISQAPKQ